VPSCTVHGAPATAAADGLPHARIVSGSDPLYDEDSLLRLRSLSSARIVPFPPMTEIDVRAFDQYEAAGWELVAAVYERVWSPSWRYRCGGDRARSASNRSGRCAAMVEIARRRHPATTFVEASVTELPFADESFDAAVGNIVIQHVGEPERATRELARVLARGGRVALSTWDAPERSPFFPALLGAIADAQVPPPSDIPAGPSFFQFADEATFQSLLRSAGFVRVSVDTISVEFPLDSADDLISALADGTVRTGALLRAADAAQRSAIRNSLDARLEEWRRGDRYVVPAPVKIAREKARLSVRQARRRLGRRGDPVDAPRKGATPQRGPLFGRSYDTSCTAARPVMTWPTRPTWPSRTESPVSTSTR
jgi:SAM-dependent methyltransferase